MSLWNAFQLDQPIGGVWAVSFAPATVAGASRTANGSSNQGIAMLFRFEQIPELVCVYG